MQVEFQVAGGVPGVPMRLLQDAGGVDLLIEGADNIPFSESVASTIALRIWVRLSFTLVILASHASALFSGRVMYNTLDE